MKLLMLNTIRQILGFAPKIGNYSLAVHAQTDVGRQRDNNQDSAAYWLSDDKTAVIAVVADGMGGHQGGEVASKMAVDIVLNALKAEMALGVINGKALQASFNQANAEIYQTAQSQPELNGMGTTLVALVIHQGKLHYANVGDSRLYRIRQGNIEQLSEDHSLVAELLKDGLITPEKAAKHPDRHIITRSIGTHAGVEVDSESVTLKADDRFLLCSDGLHDLVKPSEITDIVNINDTKKACDELVTAANLGGGHDNIAVLVVNLIAKSLSEKNYNQGQSK
ncbi:MAG: Stp1/IreP family PP2C-type Ser/Thr phosphatase [Methyloglobulus sp.]|nr:Stp1/IreP family PP2C-type Ser/Thr phosphatase [Methyloglobulus sp.]